MVTVQRTATQNKWYILLFKVMGIDLLCPPHFCCTTGLRNKIVNCNFGFSCQPCFILFKQLISVYLDHTAPVSCFHLATGRPTKSAGLLPIKMRIWVVQTWPVWFYGHDGLISHWPTFIPYDKIGHMVQPIRFAYLCWADFVLMEIENFEIRKNQIGTK